MPIVKLFYTVCRICYVFVRSKYLRLKVRLPRFSRFLAALPCLILSGWLSCAFGRQVLEVQHFAGSPGGPGTGDGIGAGARFQNPNAVWGDGTYLYVSDQNGRAIRRVDLASKEVLLLAGSLSTAGVVDSVGTAARFSGIRALWGDGVYLYLADSARIRRMTITTTQVITIAGSTSGAPVDGPAAGAVFREPLASLMTSFPATASRLESAKLSAFRATVSALCFSTRCRELEISRPVSKAFFEPRPPAVPFPRSTSEYGRTNEAR